MDTVNQYCEIVKKVLAYYAQFKPSHGDIRLDTVFDDRDRRYALMQTGWDRGRRIRGNIIYVTVRDEKVWIEYDGIEAGISDDLVALGIPEDRIVFTFLHDLSRTGS